MIYFVLEAPTPEIPAGATIAVDDTRREIAEGGMFAFRFRSGACIHFLGNVQPGGVIEADGEVTVDLANVEVRRPSVLVVG